MKHLKLFEDFFTYFKYDKLSDEDTEDIFGVSRQDIEYKLMDITDDLSDDIHTSISFSIDGSYISSDDLAPISIRNNAQAYRSIFGDGPIFKNLEIQIIFFASEGLINSREEEGDFKYESDVSDIVDSIKSSLNKHNILEFFKNLGYTPSISKNDIINSTVSNHPSGVTIGMSILTLTLRK